MMMQIPLPVIATHDIRRGAGILVRNGTPGEITETDGATPCEYTVRFRPPEARGDVVTVDHLTRTDLREA